MSKKITAVAQLREQLNSLLHVDENSLWLNIGRNVARRRQHLGITQTALADMMEFSRTSITNLERGTQQLPLVKLVKLTRFLECALDDLLVEDKLQ
jgi:transcriptional regulator with XRE-family HTH domain